MWRSFERLIHIRTPGARGVLAAFGGQDLPMEVFTDGDVQLRQWQFSTLPRASHIVDWYHLRRRVDNLNAAVKGRPAASQLRCADHDVGVGRRPASANTPVMRPPAPRVAWTLVRVD